MIAFSCPQCAQKFQVKDEFTGRSTRCPNCKQPLVVPAPAAPLAHVPEGNLDGTASSLAQAGVAGGVTLEEKAAARPSQPSVAELLARRGTGNGRYLLGKQIGRGGMGTVLRAVDGDIRREVAVKYLLDQTDPARKQRFVEEAQITGQLEHPNIVPIHELGVDSQGRLFFSMKMVKGRSLAQILTDLRDVPRIYEREWTLGRLLTLFVGICNALAYAHARGVVHRDLKPANIMVGDFGEVYVMDWGLAKVLRAPAPVATIITNPTGGAPAAIPFAGSVTAVSSGKVATSREGEPQTNRPGWQSLHARAVLAEVRQRGVHEVKRSTAPRACDPDCDS